MAKPATATKKPATTGRKTEKVIILLKRSDGASIAEITKATGWLPHSARAVLTGLRKNGFALDKTKIDGVTRYAIKGEPAV